MKKVQKDEGQQIKLDTSKPSKSSRSAATSLVGYLACLVLGAFIANNTGHSVNFCIPGSSPSGSVARSTTSADIAAATMTTSSRSSNSYGLASSQSFGFFDDIPDDEWSLIHNRVKNVHPNTNGDPSRMNPSSNIFFQNHYEPNFACRHENRIGRLGDGGKWVCDPHRLRSKGGDNSTTTAAPPCLVYSVGSNGDPSFEKGIRQDIGQHCEIHIFDMDNYKLKVLATVGRNAHYHQWGLAKENQLTPDRRGRIYKTLNQTMFELGHLNRPIDIFKIDCEGCEWSVFRDFFLPGIDLRQILIELHAGNEKNPRNEIYRKVKLPDTVDFFKAMERQYVIFHKEPNIQWSIGAAAIEYSFLKLHPSFFEGIVRDPVQYDQ